MEVSELKTEIAEPMAAFAKLQLPDHEGAGRGKVFDLKPSNEDTRRRLAGVDRSMNRRRLNLGK
ncbi:hypothetical protein [Bradyrhizobium sp. AS23.2]|uniref:hypothetical protein n=1 Tax=Bradyrhizobium sp. AS23.2 TaxID=1680155 RepID=UPI00116136D3|nr:hypothetical protein [Bradyrhizobium sp. AS23.2]